ncbi:MAG: DUF58 domain-containing protein [Planctomycetes bacterium]|nr:DUF58 domain-containing protein [Planctomycetota bacterium]
MKSPLDPALLARLQRLDLAVGKILGGEIGGRRESVGRGSGTEFLEHRSYAPGDDLRYVDWNAYGRLGELYVKQFTAEERLHLVLFVDTSPSMDFGRHNKLARARELAACLGFVALRRLDRVTLVSLGAPETPPATFCGRAGAADLLRETFSLGTGIGPPRAGAVRRTLASLPRRPATILLSDLLERACATPDMAGEERAGLLRDLAARSVQATCLHLVDPSEENPSGLGRFRLIDAESGRGAVGTLDARTLALYRERFRRHLAEVHRDALAAHVRYVRVSTRDEPDEVVLSTFRRAGVVQ